MTENRINEIVLADVHAAVDLVRGEEGPIVWLTGNSYMPPLRAWGDAETVWQTDDVDAWIQYAESFEEMLENHNIYIGCPEWDNALYAVDLTRWEYAESEDGEELGDEWTRKEVSA